MSRWSRWWIALWAANVAILVPAAFALPTFRLWTVLAVLLFGVPEAIALRRAGDAFPPLTQVVQRWVPQWLTQLLLGALIFGAGTWWLGWGPWYALRLGALGGLYGWAQDHFDARTR